MYLPAVSLQKGNETCFFKSAKQERKILATKTEATKGGEQTTESGNKKALAVVVLVVLLVAVIILVPVIVPVVVLVVALVVVLAVILVVVVVQVVELIVLLVGSTVVVQV